MNCNSDRAAPNPDACASRRERQDIRAWLSAACQKRPSHWLALRLASASKSVPGAVLHKGGALPSPPQTPADWRRALSDLLMPLHDAPAAAADPAWQVANGLHAWAQGHHASAASRPGSASVCHTALVEALFQSYFWASRSGGAAAASQPAGGSSGDPKAAGRDSSASAAAAAALHLHVGVLSHLATLQAAASAGGGAPASGEASRLEAAILACCRGQFEPLSYQRRDLRPQVCHKLIKRCSLGSCRSAQAGCVSGALNTGTLLQAGSFVLGCIAHGLVALESALAAGGGSASCAALLLGRPSSHVHAGKPVGSRFHALMGVLVSAIESGVWLTPQPASCVRKPGPCPALVKLHAGDAAALVAAQRQLPFQSVWAALESAGLAAALGPGMQGSPAQPGGGPGAVASVCEPLWGHPPLVATLLRQPQVTLRRECCDHAVHPDNLHLLQDQVHHAMVGDAGVV
jgi:hypothetical protein